MIALLLASFLHTQAWSFPATDPPRCDEYRIYMSHSPKGPWTEAVNLPVLSSDGSVCQATKAGGRYWAQYIIIVPLDPKTQQPVPCQHGRQPEPRIARRPS